MHRGGCEADLRHDSTLWLYMSFSCCTEEPDYVLFIAGIVARYADDSLDKLVTASLDFVRLGMAFALQDTYGGFEY